MGKKSYQNDTLPNILNIHAKQKSIQISNHAMCELPYCETNIEKPGKFPGSSPPHRFRVSLKICNPQYFLEIRFIPRF